MSLKKGVFKLKDINNIRTLFKWLLTFIISMVMCFFAYKAFNMLEGQWNFTVVFISGALTAYIVSFILEKEEE